MRRHTPFQLPPNVYPRQTNVRTKNRGINAPRLQITPSIEGTTTNNLRQVCFHNLERYTMKIFYALLLFLTSVCFAKERGAWKNIVVDFPKGTSQSKVDEVKKGIQSSVQKFLVYYNFPLESHADSCE